MKRIKITALMISFLLVSVFAFVGVANAQSFKAGDSVGVAANETINSMLFAAGNNIDIAGTINGDVYCAGQTINISGKVKGDVFCAGETVTISGVVDGSVRVAGQSVTLSGTIANSATVGSQNLVIDKSATIGRDLLGGGQNILLNGQIARDVVTGANVLTINGSVGRDINGQIESINVGTAGSVVGNVNYTGENAPSIASGGKIAGVVNRTDPTVEQKNRTDPDTGIDIGVLIYVFITVIVFALTLALMFPKILENSATATMKSPIKTALTGLVATIATPISIIVLLMTIIGIPVAIIVILAWLIIMLISGYFSSYLLGKLIMRKSKKPLLIMLVGISVTLVVAMIPFVNCLAFIAAVMFGIGAIVMQCRKLFERARV